MKSPSGLGPCLDRKVRPDDPNTVRSPYLAVRSSPKLSSDGYFLKIKPTSRQILLFSFAYAPFIFLFNIQGQSTFNMDDLPFRNWCLSCLRISITEYDPQTDTPFQVTCTASEDWRKPSCSECYDRNLTCEPVHLSFRSPQRIGSTSMLTK